MAALGSFSEPPLPPPSLGDGTALAVCSPAKSSLTWLFLEMGCVQHQATGYYTLCSSDVGGGARESSFIHQCGSYCALTPIQKPTDNHSEGWELGEQFAPKEVKDFFLCFPRRLLFL